MIMRGWRRTDLEGYYEKHHIIPKCIGGGNEVSNIVKLTPEEHFIAHLLLGKMYPTNHKLAVAVFLISGRCNKPTVKTNSRLYGELRRKASEMFASYNTGRTPWNKGGTHSDETRKKMSESGKKRAPISEETRAKLSASKKGKKLGPRNKPAWNKGIPMSTETKEKMSEAKKDWVPRNKGIPMSVEQKQKLSEARKLWCAENGSCKHTEETKSKISAAGKARHQKAKDKKEILQLWCAL